MNEADSVEDIFRVDVKSKFCAKFSEFDIDSVVIAGCLTDNCDATASLSDLPDPSDLGDLIDLQAVSAEFDATPLAVGVSGRLSPIAYSSSISSDGTTTPGDFTAGDSYSISNSLLSVSATPSADLSFVTAASPASSVYASAEEDSPCAPTPPTCVRAAASRSLFSSSSPRLRRFPIMDSRQFEVNDPAGESFDPSYMRQSFDPADIVDVDSTALEGLSSTVAHDHHHQDDTLMAASGGSRVTLGGANHGQTLLDDSMAGPAGVTLCERLDNVAEVTSMEASELLSPGVNGTVGDPASWTSSNTTFSRCQTVRPMFKVPAGKTKCAVASVSPIVGKPYGNAGNHSTDPEFKHGAEEFSHALDALESNSKGQLAPSLARNSLYVNFDPILGRPSVLPVVKQLRANNNNNKEETLSACDEASSVDRIRQLRRDLISFSPKSNHSLSEYDQHQHQPQLVHEGLISSSADEAVTAADSSVVVGGSAGDGLIETTAAAGESGCLDQFKTAVKSTETVGGCRQESDADFSQQLERRNSEHSQLKETVEKLQQQLQAVEASLQKSKLLNETSSSSLLYSHAQMQLLVEQMDSETRALREERDEARTELTTLESMFSDLHRKYDRSKQMLSEKSMQCEQYSEQLREVSEQMSREVQRYDMLQQYAETTIQQTRSDIDSERKTHQTELLGLSARLKLAAHKETKLEQENQELTALCDELIQKMGVQR